MSTVTIVVYPVRKGQKANGEAYFYQQFEEVQSPVAPNQLFTRFYKAEDRAFEPGTYTATVQHYSREMYKRVADTYKRENVMVASYSDFKKAD